jgi:formylglycine-generating enzyme required for sulfatase activity
MMGASAKDVKALMKRYPGRQREWFEAHMPQHRMTISEPFYLGVHPVTQAQWEAVMGNNPSQFKGNPARPVDNVSWNDVQQFLARLSAADDRCTYALPAVPRCTSQPDAPLSLAVCHWQASFPGA